MRRLITTVSLALAVAATGCGGGGDDEPSRKAQGTPAPVPSGFVAEKGEGWSFVRPSAWQPIDTGEDEPGTRYVAFESSPGTNGVASQVGVGVDRSPETKNLAKAVEVAREINKVRYQSYAISGERDLEVPGGKAHRIDATYGAYTDQPMKIKIVELLVQLDDGRQMSFIVRGPEPDFDANGLEQIVSSIRAS